MEIIEIFKKELDVKEIEIETLCGDASSRRYYKAKTDKGEFVFCQENPNGQQSIDFVRMTEIVNKHLKCPRVYSFDSSVSYIIQDCIEGESLNTVSSKRKTKERLELYKKAIDDLKFYRGLSRDDVQNYSFDDKKLNFEFDLAIKYFLEQYLNLNNQKKNKEIIKKAKETIINNFKKIKYFGCHRDYHGRNLFINNKNEIIHIDYQDARMGPYVYDLVSLIEDSYFDVFEESKTALKDYFYDVYCKGKIPKEEFYRDYETVKIQRLFKVLGSFGYLKLEKKKDVYERYIGHTFENLRKTLEENEELKDFSELICRLYYGS